MSYILYYTTVKLFICDSYATYISVKHIITDRKGTEDYRDALGISHHLDESLELEKDQILKVIKFLKRTNLFSKI